MSPWKPLPTRPAHYEVSSEGLVRGLQRDIPYRDGRHRVVPARVLSPHLRRGAPYVTLSSGGPRMAYRVARLVLAAHVGPCPAGHCVRYADGDPTNVALCNLSYAPRGAKE